VSALEAKDEYTGGHSRRVTDLALLIGGKLGLSKEQMEDLHWGALLHDVGKIAINPVVQNKPGALTPLEYQHMMTHSIVGAGIVKPVASQAVIEIIAHHHDRFDGKGLDQTLTGEEIPAGALIVAVADSFDAMTSDRPYRTRMSGEKAVAEIRRCSGSQFSPEIVAAFLEVITEYRRG
jgi:putative nucleotidyltransferase with HDIG domain